MSEKLNYLHGTVFFPAQAPKAFYLILDIGRMSTKSRTNLGIMQIANPSVADTLTSEYYIFTSTYTTSNIEKKFKDGVWIKVDNIIETYAPLLEETVEKWREDNA